MLILSDLARPENLHEVARPGLIEIVKVPTDPQLVKKTGSTWSICVPAAPDSFAIALIANDQFFQGSILEMQVASRAQRLDWSDEYQIWCAGAETWSGRHEEKFTRLEMRRRLQADLCEMRNRISAALRHLFNLLEDQAVAVPSEGGVCHKHKNRKKSAGRQSLHGGLSNHQNMNWQ
jgi:hypothetical protein